MHGTVSLKNDPMGKRGPAWAHTHTYIYICLYVSVFVLVLFILYRVRQKCPIFKLLQIQIDVAKSLKFGLVSLFNGISTLFRLFNAKSILLEEQ